MSRSRHSSTVYLGSPSECSPNSSTRLPVKSLIGEIDSNASFSPSVMNQLKEAFCSSIRSGRSRTSTIFANECRSRLGPGSSKASTVKAPASAPKAAGTVSRGAATAVPSALVERFARVVLLPVALAVDVVGSSDFAIYSSCISHKARGKAKYPEWPPGIDRNPNTDDDARQAKCPAGKRSLALLQGRPGDRGPMSLTVPERLRFPSAAQSGTRRTRPASKAERDRHA